MSSHKRDRLYTLTPREIDVITLMAQAHSNKAISQKLAISIATVRMHAKNIYAKLEVSGRQKASAKAIELGLIEHHPTTTDTLNNLPSSTIPLVGRQQELDELHQIITGGAKLITLLGAGGMGKTHLALAYARQHTTQYTDGVWFVPLEAVQTIDGIILQLIESLDIKVKRKTDYKAQVLNYLSDKQMLLVTDNWEHLLDGTTILTDILSSAPEVKLLVTSREKLSLMGEVVYLLDGLSIPDDADNVEQVKRYEAVQLIVQTANRIQPEWDITDKNVHDVVQLCHLTGGMPLAILLAISWIDVYPARDIIRQIQANVDFLQTDMQNIQPRHRDIYSVFEWTWQLLSTDEQAVFMKLSVFRNGCTLKAIEAITHASPRILSSLVSKALIYRTANNRYYVHELLRQFGATKLSADPQVETYTRDCHAEYYANLAENIVCDQLSPYDAEIELENLSKAWHWIVDTHNIPMLWRYVHTFAVIAYQASRFMEITLLFEYALSQLPDLKQTHPYLYGCMSLVRFLLYQYLRDTGKAQVFYAEGQTIFADIELTTARVEVIYAHFICVLALRSTAHGESLDLLNTVVIALESADRGEDAVHRTVLAYAYAQKAHLMTLADDFVTQSDSCRLLSLKALDIAKRLHHQPLIARITSNLGNQAFILCQYEQASHYFQEADEAYGHVISPYAHGVSLQQAGVNAFMQGDYDATRQYFRRAIDIHVENGPNRAMVSITCTVARWQYDIEDKITALALLAYCQQNRVSPYIDVLIDHLWDGVDITAESIDIPTLDYGSVVRELYSWLED